MIRSVATYDRDPSWLPAAMNSVVACPMIPAVKVFVKRVEAEPVRVEPGHLPGS